MSWAQRDTTLQKKQHFYLHSRTRLVIQIQKALWRKLEPLLSRNKMLYASKTEVTEIAQSSITNQTKTAKSRFLHRTVGFPKFSIIRTRPNFPSPVKHYTFRSTPADLANPPIIRTNFLFPRWFEKSRFHCNK